MKTAIYHQEFRDPKPFAILAEHKDGTVDLGPEGGDVVIAKCPVSAEPKPGHATLGKAPAAEADSLDAKKVDELRDMAAALGIDATGLKKAELIAAITAKQEPK